MTSFAHVNKIFIGSLSFLSRDVWPPIRCLLWGGMCVQAQPAGMSSPEVRIDLFLSGGWMYNYAANPKKNLETPLANLL